MRHAILLLLCAVPMFGQPTYSKEVSRIFQAKCQVCHRPNDIAPFALLDYDAAQTWAPDIQRVVDARSMPPWKPVAGYGDFRDSYALTDDERQTILSWVAAGAPEGDPAGLPDPVVNDSEWQNGPPDQVFQMAAPFDVPRLKDVYRCFVIPTGFTESKYLSAVEVLPGNRQIVHHVLLYLDATGASEKLDGQDGQPGYSCFGGPGVPLTLNALAGAWVPGMRIRPLADGIAVQIPPRARIIMQVHYFPNGRPGPDQSRIGVYFTKAPVERRLMEIPLVNTSFKIPAGATDYEVKAEFTVPPFADMKAIAIGPHMHLLGRKIKIEMEKDGVVTPGIYIDDWDFNWQGAYLYRNPIAVPAGTRVRMTCTYDNSANNPKNPNNPLKAVGWGEGTEDEMCLGFVGVTFDNENLLGLDVNKKRRK